MFLIALNFVAAIRKSKPSRAKYNLVVIVTLALHSMMKSQIIMKMSTASVC